MQGLAGTWDHRTETFSARLRQNQLHYDQQQSLGRVLTGENDALSPPKGFETKSGNETRPRSQRPLGFQI